MRADRELSAGDSLFDPIFTTDELRLATSDRAWVAAMLDFESALALAEADAGVVPANAAQAIASACSNASFDLGEIGRQARYVGNPAAPLVSALVDAVGTVGAGYVHFGATSQDVLDTAAMLVAKRATGIVLGELDSAADACALIVERHHSTVLAARTLLQPAVPTTFGLKAAGWLDGLLDAGSHLREVRESALAVELGGAGGTLASLGDKGIEVTHLLAHRLGLAEPRLPWHSGRVRVARLASSLAVAAGVAAKIALDVTLLMQAEVAEAAEHAGGGSSTLPHKANPVACASVSGAARRAGALAALLLQGLAQEHERATGAWQAEWQTLGDLLCLAGGAVARVAGVLESLEVDTARMRANVDAFRGVLLAERVMLQLAPVLGRAAAHELVARASRAALASGSTLAAMLEKEAGAASLRAEDLAVLDDPACYLGSSEHYVRRTLDDYRLARSQRGRREGPEQPTRGDGS